MIFTQTIHANFDTRQRRTKDILNIFRKGSVLDTVIINFENTSSHKYIGQRISLRIARSEITGYSFLVLIPKSQTLFESSSCKLLSFNISANPSWARQVQLILN